MLFAVIMTLEEEGGTEPQGCTGSNCAVWDLG